MTRRWPAEDIADYIRLIDDPTHKMNEDGTYNPPRPRPAPFSNCACSGSPRWA